MFFPRRQRHQGFDIWPGFVDAIATLLLVVIFVLMTFVLAQFYLTDALSNRDQALTELAQELDILKSTLTNAQAAKKILEEEKDSLTQKVSSLQETEKLSQEQIETLKLNLSTIDQEKSQALAKLSTLEDDLKKLSTALDQAQQTTQNQETAIHKVKDELATKSSDVDKLTKQLTDLLQKLIALEQENSNLKTENTKAKGSFGNYRSEFFTKLKQAVGDRSDIRIVGDRFVFQSEVLFDTASAELGEDGKNQLNNLISALKEISVKIPANMNWILRVDGHTDQLPIRSKYPSNWELSTARAISVVKHLISQGIDPKHLAAAGFGEFQPLEDVKDNNPQARNRRIEFKLDQR